eukprot:483835_1
MALSEKTAIFIGCIIAITVLIIFGLILWYCCSKTNTTCKPSYSKINPLPPQSQLHSTESKDEENDIINPLSDTKQQSSICHLSFGPSTNKILNMDSNNVFAHRWDSGNEYIFNEKSLNTETKQNEMSYKYPILRQIPPSSEPVPISNKYPSINTPNEVLLPLNDSDWNLIQKIRIKYGVRLNILYPDDIIRFVQGYAHEQDREIETFKRIDELLKRGFSMNEYDNQWDFQQILYDKTADKQEEECLKVWPIFFYGYDRAGHPIMYDEIGCSNPSDLDECFDGKTRKLQTFRFRILRRFHNVKRIQNMRYGYDGSVNDKGGFNNFTKQCIVMNMKNFYAQTLTAKYRNLVKNIVGDESNLWPNTLEHMFIVNSPWAFRFAWKVISNFVYPTTVEKVHILGEDYIETMKQYIDLDQIPKLYGGNGILPVKYGYAADIDNDILDGYYLMDDPIDLETVSCKKRKKCNQ